MSLGIVLKKIKELEQFANEDVESGPVETLNARRGRKTQAVETIKQLQQEYASDLRQTAAFIVVTGDKSQEFSSMATENFKCFSFDPNYFYLDLVNRLPQSLYVGKETVSNLFEILGRHLEDKMLEFQIVRGYPQLVFKQEYTVAINSKQEFVDLVKRALVEQIGGEIVGIQAVHELTKEAIKLEHTSKFTPILLPTTDEKFALTLRQDLARISNKVFIISAGKTSEVEDTLEVKELNSDNVKKVLKTISNQLKK